MRTSKPINIPSVTKKLAYFCGVLAGDGYIGIRLHKKEYVVNCGGNPNDEIEFYNNTITPLFKQLFSITIKPRLLGGKNKTYGFNVYSKSLVYFLLNDIGMTRNPKDTLIIPEIFLEDQNLSLHFIRGV